ncbi:hypothetical protein [Limnovirga soli]|uniref:Uncharacterized protein n=1 Tax=Limnovirga soli TaxID=2656915 RepID=A0A8J8JSA9_9BACT|nr:hypothetical protein [Limnovirga soli]NNV54558.1 hypothetical protein [Limnovirga soli]
MKLNSDMCDALFYQLPISLKRNIISMLQEYQSACDKHPEWPANFIEGAAIVCEESGELIRAALQEKYEKGRYYDMHKEAIQTGAMALRFLQNAPALPQHQ